MNISRIYKTDCPTVRIDDEIKNVAHSLTPGQYLVVLNGQGETVGLITHFDYFKTPKGKVKDCNLSKPPVGPDYTVNEVLKVMGSFSTDALPVYNDVKEFLGVISHMELTNFLFTELERYKLIFQKVVHDMRNPLSNIIGLNGLLEENLQKEENIKIMKMTQEASLHAMDILGELLFLERKDSDQNGIELTDLNNFIRSSLSDLKGILSTKNIELICDLPNKEFYYNIDRLHLKRTIHNLASNAIKFSNPNSKVHVTSDITGKTFTLKIQDHGIGIAKIKQPFVFDKFTNASRPGTNREVSTGLGLYFAKTCIERLKGKIWFTSTEGQGTTFFIEFTA